MFGPAEDGGYYLVGTAQPQLYIFENKPWSRPTLLQETLTEIKRKGKSVSFLRTLNDIDTVEDLKTSVLADTFSNLYK